ncbi:hypothetical protein C8R47DRAFT_1165253 [Mycena vitilis]|nr:hypothetical protein C8R47DRAFT_1165253 [Mycena vitilis]
MASVIWIDSDDDDDLIEIIEHPTPRKPLAGPSAIANTSRKRLDDKKRRQREGSPDCVIVETPRAAKVHRAENDDDHAIALALQKKWEEEDELARKRAAELDDRSLRVIARLKTMDENMAEKRRLLREKKDVPEDGIVFQVAIDSEGNTIEGDDDPDNAAHLELVKRDFEQALAAGLKLKTVRWFVNTKLEARFEAAKEALISLNIDATEKNLFHGTAETNIQPILQNGFLIPGITPGIGTAHGAACGVGIYLATNPGTSLAYTQGASRMFMCRVIAGRTTAQISHQVPLPLGQDTHESWTNSQVYVVKYPELVVPRYVVEFEANAALQLYGLPAGAALPALGRLFVPPPAPPPLPAIPGGAMGMLALAPPFGVAPPVAGAVAPLFGALPAVPLFAVPPAPKRIRAPTRSRATKRVAIVKGKGKGRMTAEDVNYLHSEPDWDD